MEDAPMKSLLLAACTSALVLAACADQPSYADAADCKTAPVTAQAAAGGKPRMNELDQRMAEMQLANSRYREVQRQRNPGYDNNIERTLQDCASLPNPGPAAQTSDASTATSK
jgi:uncharacterized protein